MVEAVGVQDADYHRTQPGQTARRRIHALLADLHRNRAAAADADIEVQAILDRFTLRYHLEPDPWPAACGIDDAVRADTQLIRELRRLTELNDALHDQLAKIPSEANRTFLAKRLEQLSTSISRDFHEYLSIERQILPGSADSLLDPQIRDAINQAIMPLQRRRERQTLYMIVSLIGLLGLTLSPIQPSALAWRYFNALDYSWNWSADSPAWMIGFGSLVVAFVVAVLASLSAGSYSLIDRLRRSKWTSIAFAVSFIVLLLLGYFCRANAETCAPLSCAEAGISVPFDPAGIFFNTATIVGGCLLIALTGLGRRINGGFGSSAHSGGPEFTAALPNG